MIPKHSQEIQSVPLVDKLLRESCFKIRFPLVLLWCAQVFQEVFLVLQSNFQILDGFTPDLMLFEERIERRHYDIIKVSCTNGKKKPMQKSAMCWWVFFFHLYSLQKIEVLACI